MGVLVLPHRPGLRVRFDDDPVARAQEITLTCEHGGEAVLRLTYAQVRDLWERAYFEMIRAWYDRSSASFRAEHGCVCGTFTFDEAPV